MKLKPLPVMLGNLPGLHNSIFLLARCSLLAALFTTICPAQTALSSAHFEIYSESLSSKQATSALSRLELLRAALIDLHGPQWAPSAPLTVFVPANEKQWLRLTRNPAEQGLFLSSSRRHWVVVNPSAPFFADVLSHEYLHAVLHHALPNLPTWFEEGICEYYSTLELRHKSGKSELLLGRPPADRLRQLNGATSVSPADFTSTRLTLNAYALAWAAAYTLWPTYKPGQPFPATIPIGPFPLRRHPSSLAPLQTDPQPLSPESISEIQATLAQSFPELSLSAPDTAESDFLSGSRLLDQSQPLAALPLLESACRQRPSQSTWWHTLGFAYRELNRIADARAALERALATAINDTEKSAARALLNSLPLP